ncbi:hypothetical protein FACS1894111_06660 [Clostridia bacterium]|nr:hypothetical protein FACS1894111_06660 [Clostridia bacterium]
MSGTYQVRQAAGLHYILRMDQKGPAYQKPLAVNQMGALIWQMLQEGKEKDVIIEKLMSIYDVERFVLQEDMEVFLEQLRSTNFIDKDKE